MTDTEMTVTVELDMEQIEQQLKDLSIAFEEAAEKLNNNE